MQWFDNKNEGNTLKSIENIIQRWIVILLYMITIQMMEFNFNCKKYRNVTYIPWHGKKRQIDAYNQACKKYEKKYKYIMFF